MDDQQFAKELGQLQGQVGSLEDAFADLRAESRKTIDELRGDIKELTAAVENARGGLKTTLLFGGVAASVGAGIVSLVTYLRGMH